MSPNSNNINELRVSFGNLLKRNDEAQDDVKIAIKSEDYAKAIKAIEYYVKIVNAFILEAVNMGQNYGDKANIDNQSICLKAVEMAEEIITAYLEVERNISKEYLKKEQ